MVAKWFRRLLRCSTPAIFLVVCSFVYAADAREVLSPVREPVQEMTLRSNALKASVQSVGVPVVSTGEIVAQAKTDDRETSLAIPLPPSQPSDVPPVAKAPLNVPAAVPSLVFSPAVTVTSPVGQTASPTAPAAWQTKTAVNPSPRKGGQYALNFDDADVYTIIQTVFGEILRANYVIDPRIKGRVTFRAIAPVPIENVLPLMEVILRLNGIGVVEDSSLYRIVPISDISKEPSPVSFGRDPEKITASGKALLQVVPILYVQSSEALKLITPFASTNAVLIDVPKANQIIIVDTDANVKRMLHLVEIFDNERLERRKPQVFVYQVQNGKAADIAKLLGQIFTAGKGGAERLSTAVKPAAEGQSLSSAPASTTGGAAALRPQAAALGGAEALVSDFTKIIADEITNTIVVLSTPEDYATITHTIEQIDVVPRQVVIESMIASVALTDNLSLGIAALFKGSISGFDTTYGLNTTGLIDPTSLTQAGFTFLATDAVGVVRGLLTALAVESKAKVLASPHILVSDNRDAKIQVGQQVPLLTSETYGAVGVSPQRNYQYRDIGIILKVKPRINQGGLVSLEIAQEISTPEKITLGDSELLLLNKTEASTNLVVQDGQTIVIGGLIRDDTTKGKSGIPLLAKIPFIGWLFGNWEDDTKRQELIILITPRVIKNQKEAKALSEEYIETMSNQSRERIKRDDLIRKRAPASLPDQRPTDGAADGTLPGTLP